MADLDTKRDELLRRAARGEISPDKAEGEAARLGIGTLEITTKKFNPLKAPSWTLTMVAAWIVWRDLAAVAECWNERRQNCEKWQGRQVADSDHVSYRLTPQQPVNLDAIFGLDRFTPSSAIIVETAADPLAALRSLPVVVPPADARLELQRALQTGLISATWKSKFDNTRRRIPPDDWHGVSLDEPRYGGPDDVGENEEGLPIWEDVLVDRQSAIDTFPAVAPEGLPPFTEIELVAWLRAKQESMGERPKARGFDDPELKLRGVGKEFYQETLKNHFPVTKRGRREKRDPK